MTIKNEPLIIGLSIIVLGSMLLLKIGGIIGGILISILLILIPISLVIYEFQPLHRYLKKKGGGDKKMSELKIYLEQDDKSKIDLKFSNSISCSLCRRQQMVCIGFEEKFYLEKECHIETTWICYDCLTLLSDKLLKIQSAFEIVNT